MYQYRKHLRGSFLNYFTALIIFMSFVFLCVLGGVLLGGESLKEINFLVIVIIIVGFLLFLLLELLLLYFIFLQRFRYINVQLTEDSIVYNNKKKKVVIPYDEIVEIKYPSIRYMGGWMEIKHTNGKIRLTVALKNIGEFMSKLKEKLDNLDKSSVYNEKKSFNFFKTATFSDESWERLYSIIKYILAMEYLSVFMVVVLASLGIIYGEYSMVIGGIFAPVIGYLIVEFILGRRVSKRIVDNEFKVLPVDRDKEKKYMRASIAISTILYALILIL
ncbi:MAG: hypothetical protein E7212_04455 [Clostridium sartagoforme]|nr:hypothetical protein [Clostridium sartagoforme]